MREGRQVFLPRLSEFRRHTSLRQCVVREASESHEVEPGDGVPFDKFKHKQHNHAHQPGMLHEFPPTPYIRCHPGARDEEDDGTGHHDTIIEDCNVADSLGEESEVVHFPRPQI